MPRTVLLAWAALILPAFELQAQIEPLSATGLKITPSPTQATRTQNTNNHTVVFTVLNQDDTAFHALTNSCTTTGPVTCTNVTPTYRATLNAGASYTVTVTYNVGLTGSGEVVLRVEPDAGGLFTGTHLVFVSGPPIITLVAPVLTSGSRAVVRNRHCCLALRLPESVITATIVPAIWSVTRWRTGARPGCSATMGSIA